MLLDALKATPAGAFARRVLSHPIVHLLLILLIYVQTRKKVWGALTAMPAATFDSPVITFRALFVPHVGVTMAVLVVLAAISLRIRWTDLESGRALRIAWSMLVALSVLITAGIPYNFLTGQAYIIDRLIVVVLGALVVWRPAFAPLFLAIGLIISAQVIPSIDRALNWTERRLLLDVQIAFAAFFVLRRILPVRTSTFVLFALVVIGSSYWYPGVNKLTVGEHFWTWALEDDLGALFVSTYVDGWLPWLGDARAVSLGVFLGNISPLLCIGTLCVELSAPALFFKRRLSIVLLFACVAMHIGILVSSGIFFYKWIAVDLTMAYLLSRAGGEIFSDWRLPVRLAGAALVVTSPFVLLPYKLAWFDTRLSQVLQIEAVLEDGSVREVSPTAFKPFDVPIAQGRFHYVADHATPVGVFGAVQSTGRRVWGGAEHVSGSPNRCGGPGGCEAHVVRQAKLF